MAPDASKYRQGSTAYALGGEEDLDEYAIKQRGADDVAAQNTDSIECILREPARRLLTDFSYMEQPMRCTLSSRDKRLSCIGKNACYMTDPDDPSALDEFALLPQPDGSVVIQNTKSTRYLCSSSSGEVYASSECCNEEKEKWIMTEFHHAEGEILYYITSVASHRNLACSGSNMIHTIENDRDDTGNNSMLWTIDLLSGELCFLSLPSMDRRVRCDIVGKLSLSKNFLGWEAWRLSEAGNGHVRISPWAHAGMFLSSDDQGQVVCTTFQQKQRGSSQLWKVEKAPNRLAPGVVISSVPNGRVLSFVEKEGSFCTISGCRSDLDESCVWDFESLHRQTYYLVTSGDHGSSVRRLEAAKKGLGTRGLPGRLLSEEWKIQTTKGEYGVVTLFSSARKAYLGSNASGQVFLMAEPNEAAKWVMEEREEGFVVSSHVSQRVLVSPRRGTISTVEPGTIVVGTARWKLEPKIPRQVSKEKMQAVGAAVAIGVVGTVATPFLIGGAIGAIGVANVGLAGNVAIGSIRAAEVLNTITRITMSSSELIRSQSSFLSTDSAREQESSNRPFCHWRSW